MIRHRKTVEFMLANISVESTILDLGVENELGYLLKKVGYHIKNTDFDLDIYPRKLREFKCDVCIGFEILEHLLEPAQVLKNIRAKEIVVSVPMKRMFEKTYWEANEYEQHYHEFETFQFDKLLKYCNYEIIHSEKWKNYSSVIGRIIYQQPKFYIVHAINLGGGKSKP